MAATAEVLLETDDTNHGSAFYMLSGTSDFEYVLDIMQDNDLIDEDTASAYLTTNDGYRLRLMMIGMKQPLDSTDDIEAICLDASTRGTLCAGLRYNGSSLMR